MHLVVGNGGVGFYNPKHNTVHTGCQWLLKLLLLLCLLLLLLHCHGGHWQLQNKVVIVVAVVGRESKFLTKKRFSATFANSKSGTKRGSGLTEEVAE